MSESKTNGSSSRVGDHALALGMHRFANHNDDPLWVWSATKYCGGDAYLKIPGVTVADLFEMRTIIDRQIKELKTDGGRNNAPTDC